MTLHHASASSILDTIAMVEKYRLDIRTVTMGINLLGCRTPEEVYARCVSRAARLVEVCEGIEQELGIPIVNKRISVTPVALLDAPDPVAVAKALDRAAKHVGVNFIGGYSALVEKGATAADLRLIESIPEALAITDIVCASVNVASSRAGINMDAVALLGRVIRQCAEHTKERNAIGCAKLVVFANSVDDNPFMAGAYHGVTEPDCVVNVGVSGPGVVDRALGNLEGASLSDVAEEIKKAAFKITRTGQLVGTLASERLGVPFGIVDLSLAPIAEVRSAMRMATEKPMARK